MNDLVDISGIGPAAKALLIEHGFGSVSSIAGTSVVALSKVPGFGPVRSKEVIEAAKALVAVGSEANESVGKDKKKDKKKGKGKK